MTDTCNSHK